MEESIISEPYYRGFNGEKIPVLTKNPDSDLSINERRLFNILKLGPKTHNEIRKYLYVHPVEGLVEVSDLERMLRSLREKKYIKSVPQRNGPQKWEVKI